MTVKAKLHLVNFDQSADIWALAGYDLTMWVLQYVQSQISNHKSKADRPETGTPSQGAENHGLVGTGVSLTCSEGADKTQPAVNVKQEEGIAVKTEGSSTPARPARPAKSDTKTSINDKIPDSAYTLLSTASLPFPQFSIRKNFRTFITEPSIAPAGMQSVQGDQTTTGVAGQPTDGAAPAVAPETKPQEVVQRQINTGKYCPQVLGKEGSVRVAKTWQVP